MLYLHKLLPVVLLPVGITIVLVGTGLVFRKRILCWAGLGLLYLFSTGLVSENIMGLIEGGGGRRKVEGVEPAEAVVVLSGMLRDRKDAPLGEWSGAVDRFEGGVGLLRAQKAPLLIFTGGFVPWRPEDRPEGEILKERAVNLGVPRENILVTGKVENTEAEASAVKKMIKDLKFRELMDKPRIILVTSAYHMRRARMLFQRQGLEVEPFPVDFQLPYQERMTIISFLPNAECLKNSETAMREAMGIFYYTFIKR